MNRNRDSVLTAKYCASNFCLCFVDLLIVFLAQVQREVSHVFLSGPGLAVHVPPGPMACAELCFEALSVIQPCLVYQSYMSHTTVIWSRAVSTRRCYSCSTALPSRWKKEARLIDWLERVMVLSAIRCDLETCLVLTRAICCFVKLISEMCRTICSKICPNLAFSEILTFWF